MRKFGWRNLLSLLRGQRGSAGILMVLAFMALVVPVAVGTLTVADQLVRSSNVFDKRLKGMYFANSGVEIAIWKVLDAPEFTDILTPVDPCTEFVTTIFGDPITVTVCQIFTTYDLAGQGIVVTKSVSPATAPEGVSTEFTYTLTLANQGTGDAQLKNIYDYLPPWFDYVSGSTTGLSTREPTANNSTPLSCGRKPYQLFWNLESDNVTLAAGQEATLTFRATAALSPGTYYNQASARYVPWWTTTGTAIDTFTPFTAEVVVGGGVPYCGYDLNVRVTKEVEPPIGQPGVEAEYTYTVTAENLSSGTRYVCKIEDRLPPDFSYIVGSAAEYPSNIVTAEPALAWNGVVNRWTIAWAQGQGNSLDPLVSLEGGETRTQVFRTRAIPQPGVEYFNEISAVWSKQLVGGHCKTGSGDGGASTWGGAIEGGASGESSVEGLVLYDITAVAADGSVRARIQYSQQDGAITVLSWQQF